VAQTCRLVRPEPFVFDPFHVSIHGISPRDVAGAPTFAEIWPSVWATVSGPLVAHNAAFDMSALRSALDRCGTHYPEADYFCTRVLSKIAWPNHPTYALDFLAGTLGIEFRHHDAGEDARACALLAIAACGRLNAPRMEDLESAAGVRIGRLFPGGYSSCGGPRARTGCGSRKLPLRASDVKRVQDSVENDHPFCGRRFVFTGALSCMPRADAMQAVVDRGGICQDAVRSDTDCLVLGQDGFRGYRNGQKTSKMHKAEELRSKGAPIEIMSESDFLALL